MDDIYARRLNGYRVVAWNASSASQGGVVLVWKEEHDSFKVEEVTIRHPNVLSFELNTGGGRYYVVGCYIPPSSLETLEHVRKALKDAPADKSVRPMLWGDLNAHLDVPLTGRDEEVADVVDGEDLIDALR